MRLNNTFVSVPSHLFVFFLSIQSLSNMLLCHRSLLPLLWLPEDLLSFWSLFSVFVRPSALRLPECWVGGWEKRRP